MFDVNSTETGHDGIHGTFEVVECEGFNDDTRFVKDTRTPNRLGITEDDVVQDQLFQSYCMAEERLQL
jgi:hypothetical protein